jgi:hypothetical protein
LVIFVSRSTVDDREKEALFARFSPSGSVAERANTSKDQDIRMRHPAMP